MLSSISAVPRQSASDEPSDPWLVEETGHWLTGEFFAYYNSVSDPERIFGAPITDVFPDELRPGYQIQYFERARMDYNPNQPAGKRIALAPLGEWLYTENQAQQRATTAQNNGMCRVFAGGKQVCYGFLQFFDLNDGARLLGRPVSDLLWVDGRYVQYFQNARLEWRTELPAGQRVVVSELGRIDFISRIGNLGLLDPSTNIPESVVRHPRVRAFVASPLVTRNSQQRVDVIVRDQFKQPMINQPVTVTVGAPDQPPHSYSATTNADGLATVRFPVDRGEPNQVMEVRVDIGTPDDTPEAATWFRMWW
jgi:hypothetical protein